MNVEMAVNSELATIESKKQTKLKKQNRNRIIGMGIIWRVIGRKTGRMGEKVQGLRSTNW